MLDHSPSISEGLTPDKERSKRTKGCTFITLVGTSLRIPQTTIATACILFHRFYLRNSILVYNYHDIGGTCLFIACKIEETPKSLRELIATCARKAHKDDSLAMDESSKEFFRWRETIIYHEGIVLMSLCYDLDVEKPYDSLMEMLSKTPDKKLLQTAWCIINDSLRTTVCVRFPARVIALAALLLATRLIASAPPSQVSKELEANSEPIKEIITEITDLYTAFGVEVGPAAAANLSKSLGPC
ncbi:hypothetical protein HK105_208615 [Polyrhizophydium stewartii]|uniref:Cyclin-like domain-containing protein n=1 Tax=Polyrhizophydium stewartii TaxID=2732419 RepID=A0ABR4MX97_9FUNG|nr:hypothetical protein HK105_008167 [Polyrhizophydium stewartii]